MKNTNIILVTDVPPDIKYTAGQVLNRVISKLPGFHFNTHWLNQSNLENTFSLPRNCRVLFQYNLTRLSFLSSFSNVINSLSRRLPSIKKILLIPKSFIYVASIVPQALVLALRVRNEPARIVWLVVQGDRLVFCYLLVAVLSKKPYVLQQWDPLSWWMDNRQYPKWFQNIMKRLLYHLESRAYMNLVPSDIWRDKLISQKKNALRLDNFIERSILDLSRFVAVREPNVFHAVFIGQIYAKDELTRLIDALKLHLKSKDKKLVIHYYGSSNIEENFDCQFVFHGYMDTKELIESISQWELALLPYPTEILNTETALLSFPSKVRIYLSGGLPILALAPSVSGIHQFLNREYAEYYQNILNECNLDRLINHISDLSYGVMRLRFETARGIVKNNFSEQVELEPLKRMLEKIS